MALPIPKGWSNMPYRNFHKGDLIKKMNGNCVAKYTYLELIPFLRIEFEKHTLRLSILAGNRTWTSAWKNLW